MMSKRKPDQTIVHRIEMQSKEREMLQDYLVMDQANKLISSVTSMIGNMSIEQMYGWLTLAEAMGWLDTPIPTITDADEMAAAFVAWATGIGASRKEEAKQRDEYAEGFREDYVPPEEDQAAGIPSYGTTQGSQNTDDETDYSDPANRWGSGPSGYPTT